MFLSSFQSLWYVWLKLYFTVKLVYAFLNKTFCFSRISLALSNFVQLLSVRDLRAPTAPMSLPIPGPRLSCPAPLVPAPVVLQQCQSPAPHRPALPGHWPCPPPAYPCPFPLMSPGLPCSLAGTVGWALLIPIGNCHCSWSCWSLMCSDNYLVFILLTCQKCVIRCKTKTKSCREPMRWVLGAGPPLLCISIAVSHVFFLHIIYFLLKPSLAGYWKAYIPAACSSSFLGFHALKHSNLDPSFLVQQCL